MLNNFKIIDAICFIAKEVCTFFIHKDTLLVKWTENQL